MPDDDSGRHYSLDEEQMSLPAPYYEGGLTFKRDTEFRKQFFVPKYQANFPPCPICGRPKEKRAKTCAFCAGKGSGAIPRRKYVEKTCKYCKSQFSIPLWRERQGRGVFCSRECANKYLTTLTGGRSIRWRGGTAGHRRGIGWNIAKQWALVRANGKCERCGLENGLAPHHIKPYRECKDDVEANSPKNLIVLCRSCHAIVERLGKLAKKVVMPR